jgi:hypothetical protein
MRPAPSAVIKPLLLAIATLGAIPGTTTLASDPDGRLYRDRLFRESFSLDATRDHIRDVRSRPGTRDNAWNIALTDDEVAKVERLLAYQDQDGELLMFVRSGIQGSAGVYHDNRDEDVYVISTVEPLDPATVQHIRSIAPEGASIRFRVVARTMEQLATLRTRVDADLRDLEGFAGSEVDIVANAVRVSARRGHVDAIRAAVAGLAPGVIVVSGAGDSNVTGFTRDPMTADLAASSPDPSPGPTREPTQSERAVELVRAVDPRFADIPMLEELQDDLALARYSVVLAGPWIGALESSGRIDDFAGTMGWFDLEGRVVQVMLVGPCDTDADAVLPESDPCGWRHTWLYHVDPAGTVTLVYDAGSDDALWPGPTPSPEPSPGA